VGKKELITLPNQLLRKSFGSQRKGPIGNKEAKKPSCVQKILRNGKNQRMFESWEKNFKTPNN